MTEGKPAESDEKDERFFVCPKNGTVVLAVVANQHWRCQACEPEGTYHYAPKCRTVEVPVPKEVPSYVV